MKPDDATNLLDFLQQASDAEFDSWLSDPNREKFDQAAVSAAKALAEDLDDLHESLRVIGRVQCIPDVQEEPLFMALILRARANVCQAHEQFEASLAASQSAIDLYHQHGTLFQVAVASVIQVVVLGLMGRYDQALALARRIHPWAVGRRNSRLVLGHLALGRAVAHMTALRLKSALADYRRALRHFSLLPNRDAEIALTLLNMGVLGNQMDRLDEARAWLLQAFATFEEEESPINLAKTFFALAHNHMRSGEHQIALDYLARARTVLEQRPDSPDNGFVDLETAAVWMRLNQVQQAEELARQALARFEHLNRSLDTAEALLFLARVLSRATTHAKLEEASSCLERAERILQKHDMPVFVAWIQLEQSELLLYRNLTDDARLKAEVARHVFVREKLVLLHAQAQLVLGDSCWRWEPIAAKHHYEAALALLDGDLNAALAARACRGLGRLASIAGRWKEAETHFAGGLQALDRLRRNLRSHVHQAGFLEDKRPLAMELFAAINAEVAAGRHSSAHLFGWLERWKAVALADLLAGQPPDLALDAETKAILAARERLLSQFDELQRIRERSGAGPALSLQRTRSLLAENEGRVEELARLRRQLQMVDEMLAPRQTPSMAWRQGATIDSTTIHELLDADTLLVSYYNAATPTTFQDQGSERLYAVSVTNRPGDLEMHDLHVTSSEVTTRWEHIFELMTDELPVLTERRKEGLQMRLGHLYTLLIHPFAARLAGKQRVIILPERDLAHIPFAALYDSETGRYLAEQLAIQAAPSAAVLNGCRRRPAGTLPPVLIGYPGEPGSAKVLSNVRPEIETIAGLFQQATRKPAVLLDDNATLDNFWQNVPGCSLLHVAGHADFDPQFPLESGIELAAGRSLRAADLYLRYGLLAGASVVLSGCSTGQVRSWGGDTLGLISAFLYAGASSVTAGLWPVDDRATSLIMPAYYENLVKGDDTATALRKAQIDLLNGEHGEQFRSPYYWAAFALCGDSRTLQPPPA